MINNEIYNDEFFAKYGKDGWNDAPKLGKAIYETVKPKSSIDLGCGAGLLVGYLQDKYNIDAYGIEGSEDAVKYFPESVKHKIHVKDLTRPLNIQKHTVSICLEVAEHIENYYSEILVENCVKGSDNYIVFSAAPPGQGGKGHINCQPWSFWEKLFNKYGFHIHKNKSAKLTGLLKKYKAKKWYVNNTRVLQGSDVETIF